MMDAAEPKRTRGLSDASTTSAKVAWDALSPLSARHSIADHESINITPVTSSSATVGTAGHGDRGADSELARVKAAVDDRFDDAIVHSWARVAFVEANMEQQFLAQQFIELYSMQRYATGFMTMLLLVGTIGQVVQQLLRVDGELDLTVLTVVYLAMFVALALRSRSMFSQCNSLRDSPDGLSKLNRLSVLQCVAFGTAFFGSNLRTLFRCHPDRSGFETVPECNGFQYNVFPASFLVYVFMFPHLIVNVYRPAVAHCTALIVSAFWILPSTVGSLLPARFGFGYGASPALFIVLGLNALLAIQFKRRSGYSRRVAFLRQLKLRATLVSLEEAHALARDSQDRDHVAHMFENTLNGLLNFADHYVRNPLHVLTNVERQLDDARSQDTTEWSELCSVMGGALSQLTAVMDQTSSLRELAALATKYRCQPCNSPRTRVHVRSWVLSVVARVAFPELPRARVSFVGGPMPSALWVDRTVASKVVAAALRFSSETCGTVSPCLSVEYDAGPGSLCMVVACDPTSTSSSTHPFMKLGVPLCENLCVSVGGSAEVCVSDDSPCWQFRACLPASPTTDACDNAPSAALPAIESMSALELPGSTEIVPIPIVDAPGPLGLHVLVVDDEVLNCKILVAMLAKLGCSADVFSDGADVDVGKVAAENKHSVVLTDIVMPRQDGVALCKELRLAGVRVPIIATTANSGQEDWLHYKAAGFNDMLPKPFSPDSLRKTLQRWCNKAP